MANESIIANRELTAKGNLGAGSGAIVLKRKHILLMAICTGLIVANIYYCQPLIVLIGNGLGISAAKAGSIVFFTQSGL